MADAMQLRREISDLLASLAEKISLLIGQEVEDDEIWARRFQALCNVSNVENLVSTLRTTILVNQELAAALGDLKWSESAWAWRDAETSEAICKKAMDRHLRVQRLTALTLESVEEVFGE